MFNLEGKTALVFGAQEPVVFSIIDFLHKHGVKLLIALDPNYYTQKQLDEDFSQYEFACLFDPFDEVSMMKFFFDLKTKYKTLNIDLLIYGINFAQKEDLACKYCQISKENFLKSMQINCFLFTHIMNICYKFILNGGSCLALTKFSGNQVIKNYNIMGVSQAALESSIRYLANDFGHLGIRVNSLAIGPLRDAPFYELTGHRSVLESMKNISPLKTNVSTADAINMAAFLLSDYSLSITGENFYLNAGVNYMIKECL